jgi:hypothetical protein
VFFFNRYEVQTPGGDPKANPGQKQKVLLDENDELWTELRHQHIAVVTQYVFVVFLFHCLIIFLFKEYYEKNKRFCNSKTC